MVRVSWREDMAHRARARENFGVADRILNSIAREVGDVRPMVNNPHYLTNEDRLRAAAVWRRGRRREDGPAARPCDHGPPALGMGV